MPRIEENSSASVASGVVRRTTCAAAGEAAPARAARARGKRARKGRIAGKDAPPGRRGGRGGARRGGEGGGEGSWEGAHRREGSPAAGRGCKPLNPPAAS